MPNVWLRTMLTVEGNHRFDQIGIEHHRPGADVILQRSCPGQRRRPLPILEHPILGEMLELFGVP